MTTIVPLDSHYCETLATRVIAGEPGAWQLLVQHVWPHLLRHAGAMPRIRHLRTDDGPYNVATVVLERLSRDRYEALRHYLDRRRSHEAGCFQSWLFTVSTNAANDDARKRFGRRSTTWDGPSRKRLLNELADSAPLDDLGTRPPVTAHQTARQVLEAARLRLRGDQYAALELWLKGHDPGDIASSLGIVDEEEAHRLLRSAIAVLRRSFGTPEN